MTSTSVTALIRSFKQGCSTGVCPTTFGIIILYIFVGILEVIFVLAFGFLLHIFGDGRDLQMVLYHSMNVGSVLGILQGDGNTLSLPYAKELV